MKLMKKTDLIVVLVLLICSAGVWYYYSQTLAAQSAKAEIYLGSELVETIPLHTGEEKSFSIPQNEHVIFHLGADGSIAFEASDCPDKVCVRTGALTSAGQTAACLPNQMILKLVPVNQKVQPETELVVG